MPWTIETRDDVVVAWMRSNPVNKMNPQFFDDLQHTLDAIERDHPRLPLVLTAMGGTFSAGLDFEDVFPRFARRDMEELERWFDHFRQLMLRVFTLPRRTVAAVNGNAFAGGLILTCACDARIVLAGPARFSINEVPIGIPMPAIFTEIIRYAVGSRVAAECILSGRIYDVEQALAAGFFHRSAADPGRLLDEAIAMARIGSPDVTQAYAASKHVLLHPVLKQLAATPELDRQALQVVMHPDSVRAQAAALERLKRKR